MVLTRLEKEELVKELYEQDKTIREIAKEVHMSFTDIAAIIRKVTGDSSKDSNTKPIVSKETKALRLFSTGNSPVDVAIELDISSDETEELYLGFWRLKQLPYLAFICKELGSQLPSFIKLYKLLKSTGITEEEAVNLINDAKQIPFLRNTFLDLTNKITNLEERGNSLLSDLSDLQSEIERRKGYLQYYMRELNRMNFEVMEKNRELQYLKQLTNAKRKDYVRLK